MKAFRYFFLLILIFTVFSCKKNDENLDLKYEVLNQLISDDIELDKLNPDKVEYLYQIAIPINLTMKEEVSNLLNDEQIPPPPIARISIHEDSIFSKQDVDYILAQNKTNTEFELDKNRIHPQIKIIDKAKLLKIQENYSNARDYWDKFRKEFGEKCIRSYSLPHFNKEKKFCIINISMACGPLEGGGGTYILKKVKGKWKHYKTIESFVS